MPPPRPVQILNFTGGINQSLPRDQIRLSETPAQQNFTIIDGIAQKRKGYQEVAYNPVSGGSEPFLGGRHYGDGFSNKKRFWAVTNKKAYIAETIGGSWTDKTNSMKLQGGDDQYVSMTECVDRDDYKNHLLICQNHTNPLTALNGTRGGDESVVWNASAPDGSLAVLEGALGYNDATGDDYHRAKQVINFQGSVFLCHTYERVNATTWASLSYRIRWSDQYKFGGKSDDSDNDKRAAWNPNGVYDSTETSLAGYWDARLGYGAFVRAAKLRNNLVIFFEEAITVGVQTTNYTDLFTFRTRVPEIGLYAPRLLIPLGDRLCFVGSDREIYQYFGGADPDPIGGRIRSEFFDTILKTEAVAGYPTRNRSFGVHLRDRHAVGFFIPVNSNYPDVGYIYFYRENRWEKVVLPVDGEGVSTQRFCGVGEWQRPTGVTAENVPIVGDEAGNVLQWDYATVNDYSTAIDAWIQTPDQQIAPKYRQDVTDVWFEASGDGAASSVKVAVSLDAGANFSSEITKSITGGWASYNVTFANQGGYRFRLRFRNNTADQKLLLGRIWTEPTDGGEVYA